MTDAEKSELDEFLSLIEQAAAAGTLDSQSANAKLAAAEASLREGSPLEDPQGAVRTIFEAAQSGKRRLTGREQAVVMAAARQLGFNFSRMQAFRLFYALERGEPPAPKVQRLSWWRRIVRTLRRWVSGPS